MTALFPFFGDTEIQAQQESEDYTEIAWDYKHNRPVVIDGEYQLVHGAEAIKSWCYRALQVDRYSQLIYTWDHGSELSLLIGQPYSKALAQSECARFVEECLTVNPHIKGVANVSSSFEGGLLTLSCDLVTTFGETSLEEVTLGV